VALTRPVLQGALMLPYNQIDAMLCLPAFRVDQECCSDDIFHKLRCGHLVRSMLLRSCASNCIDSLHGVGIFSVSRDRQSDAIMCLECVTRAERIFQRYERLRATMARGADGAPGRLSPQAFQGLNT
jgi:hypothetical protein